MKVASTTIPGLAATVRFLPPVSASTTLPVVQTIELVEDDKVIASAIWFTHGTDGVVQLLDIRVDERHRRRRVGSRLFQLLKKECDLFFRSRGRKLRRFTAEVEQKTQITSRAFFTQMGFHHVQSIPNSLIDQDIVIYLLGCD